MEGVYLNSDGSQLFSDNFLDSIQNRVVNPMGELLYGPMKFKEKLARLIDLRDTSQMSLERKTGIKQSAISEMINKQRKPRLDQGFLLSRALDVSLDWLADDEAEGEPPSLVLKDWEQNILFMARNLGQEEAAKRLLTPVDEPWFRQAREELPPNRKAGGQGNSGF